MNILIMIAKSLLQLLNIFNKIQSKYDLRSDEQVWEHAQNRLQNPTSHLGVKCSRYPLLELTNPHSRPCTRHQNRHHNYRVTR